MPKTLKPALQKAEQQERKFRPEIQGLRALAVLLVAAYHFWFGRVSGGVDVFLLISAFLMAGSFSRKIERGTFSGPKAVFVYWVHVFKRILPLATLTVLGILLGVRYLIPQERWLTLIDESKAVMRYRENWWSIKNLVDYYAADSSQASPFRHFWSLSLQGQIYLLWPLIFLFAWVLIRLFRLPAKPTLLIIFGGVFAASLSYSVHVTATSQQTAYFNTWARLWEFALGTIAALLVTSLTLPRLLRAVMGWAGIALIISCGFVLDVEGKFPGYYALWPTLAATLIILAGDTGTRFGPEKLLTLKPLLKLGGFSYALYLFHWPLLIFYLARTGGEKAGFGAGIVLLAVSILLAWAATRFIETPLRKWRLTERTPIHALGFVLVFLVAGLGPSYLWKNHLDTVAVQAEANRALNNEGARTLEAGYVDQSQPNATILPVRTHGDDWAYLGKKCAEVDSELPLTETQLELCTYPHKVDEPTKTVVAVGNSHMQMWTPALVALAEEENWNLILLTKGGCFYGLEDIKDDELYDACVQAAGDMQAAIEALDPDVVVLTGTLSAPNEKDTLLVGIEKRINQLTKSGTTVVGIRDTPRMETMHKTCMDSGKSLADCVMEPGQDVYHDPQLTLEVLYPGFGAVNMSDVVCPNNQCPVAIGNVYTYMDYDHLTSTYVETTTDFFSTRMKDAIRRAEINSGASEN